MQIRQMGAELFNVERQADTETRRSKWSLFVTFRARLKFTMPTETTPQKQ